MIALSSPNQEMQRPPIRRSIDIHSINLPIAIQNRLWQILPCSSFIHGRADMVNGEVIQYDIEVLHESTHYWLLFDSRYRVVQIDHDGSVEDPELKPLALKFHELPNTIVSHLLQQGIGPDWSKADCKINPNRVRGYQVNLQHNGDRYQFEFFGDWP